jgi:peroxidase
VYKSVDDVDLYVAGLAEKPLPSAALGPTFAGIFAAQFLNLRRTDRFFYDHNVDGTTKFSSSKNRPDIFIIQRIINYYTRHLLFVSTDQLAEIQKVSLARIICDNSDGTIARVQPKAFLAPEG